MYSFGLLVRLTFQVLTRSDPRQAPWGWRRLLVFLGLLFVVLPWQAVHSLALGLDRWLYRFEELEPRPPLFVVGVPRSGTTLLHRLLTLGQTNFTSFSLWELLFAPAICQKQFWRVAARLDRVVGGPGHWLLTRCERLLFGQLDAIHGTSLDDPEEDYLGLISVGGCFLLVHAFPFSSEIWRLVQSLRLPGDGESTPPHGEERARLVQHYRRLVQRHLYVYGPEKTLISKNPSFTPWVPELRRAFPGAHFVGCVRDPAEAIPSLLSSMESGARWTGNPNNRAWQSDLVAMAKSFYYLLVKEYPDSEREFKLMEFSRLTSDPRQCLREICEEFGLESFEFHDELEKACATATNYTSKHRYDAAQFGLALEEICLELEFVQQIFSPDGSVARRAD